MRLTEMGNILRRLQEHFETDEEIQQTLESQYYSLYITALGFPIFTGKTKYWSVLLILLVLTLMPFYIYLTFTTAILAFRIDSTLFVLEVMIFSAQLCAIIFWLLVTYRRKYYFLIHKEMFITGFDYNESFVNQQLVDSFNKNATRIKYYVAVMILLVQGSCVYMIWGRKYLDVQYGHINKELIDLGVTFDLFYPLRYPVCITDNIYLYFVAFSTQVFSTAFIGYISGISLVIIINILSEFNRHHLLLVYSLGHINMRCRHLCLENRWLNDKIVERAFVESESELCLSFCLKKVVQHHQTLIRWWSTIMTATNGPLGIATFTNALMLGMNLFILNSVITLPGCFGISLLYSLINLVAIWTVCHSCEIGINLREEFRWTLYSTDWYNWPKSLKQDILILQEMSKRPLTLKIYGLYPINLVAFTDTMNSAYSYYNIVRLTV